MILEESSEKRPGGKSGSVALSSLSLRDFRNYESATVEPSPRINIVAGKNAQGKTSLLEAIVLVSRGRVLRSTRDAHAIRHGQTVATVEARLAPTGTKIGVILRAGERKRVELNGLGLPRAADVIGRLPTVSFSSTDLPTVTGDASQRRDFMDWELAQTFPAYLRHLSLYKRALEQRNSLLKQAQERSVPANVFEPWEQQMAAHGEAIRETRENWIGQIGPSAAEAHAELGGNERLQLTYERKDEENLVDAYGQRRGNDIMRGTTTLGPHRDDLRMEVDGVEARYFGSQGQQRTAVIALKMAVLDALEDTLGFAPALLLDDVFSDLDVHRRAHLVERTLKRGGQVFLTCTEPEQAGTDITDDVRVFQVESGRIQVR